MRFIWDPAKAALNYAKHGVSFGDALTVFDDPKGLYIPDRNYSERGNLIGHSAVTQLLFVVHVELLTDTPPATRLISARPATGPERGRYYAQFESLAEQKARRKKHPERKKRGTRPPQPKKRRRSHEEE